MQDSRGKIKTLSITIKVLDNDERVRWTLTGLQRMRDIDKEIFSSHCKRNQFKVQKSHFYRNRLLKSVFSLRSWDLSPVFSGPFILPTWIYIFCVVFPFQGSFLWSTNVTRHGLEKARFIY